MSNLQRLFHGPKLGFRVKELAQSTGMSRRFICDEIRYGRLKSVKLGSARVILAADAEAWLDNAATQQDVAHRD